MVDPVTANPAAGMEQAMTETSLLEQIKQAPEKLANKFDFTKEKALELSIYLVGGFLLGFLLKRFNRVIVTTVIVILGLLTLEYFHIIDLTVHWSKVRELLGMQPLPTVNGSMFSALWIWAKDHLSQVISFTVGFLAGLKLG